MTAVAFIRLLRPKQWIKNLFVFAALVFSQHLFEWEYARLSIIAFLLFCATASSIYIVNDILDRDRDRLHPRKKHRPIASGAINIPSAISMAIIIFVAIIPLALDLPYKFGLAL